MRQAVFALSADDGGFHPADRVIAEEPTVHRRSVREITLLDDGTCVVLQAFSGDVERGVELVAGRDDVIDFEVYRVGEREALALSHVESTPTLTALLQVMRRQEIVVLTPIACLPAGGIRPVVVGKDSAIQAAVERVPDDLTVRLESIGPYRPRAEVDFFASLTERQRDVLVAAVEAGYYEVPRRTTHEQLAERVGLSKSTVGEHLRKVEAAAIEALAPRRYLDAVGDGDIT